MRIKLLKTITEVLQTRSQFKSDQIVSFVPTMGNLHSGHGSLIQAALKKCDICFISIFINPLQFDNPNDLARYPKSLDQDLDLISKVNTTFDKEVYVFCPEHKREVFPENYMAKILVTPLNNDLEGQKRPGHFDGVSTVVYRLFSLIQPHHAFFGKKDYQQLVLIRKMVKDLLLPIKIHGVETARDDDGLALSSRNQFLSPDQRIIGLNMRKALLSLKKFTLTHKDKTDWIDLINIKIKTILNEDSKWDYLEVRNTEDLSAAKHSDTDFVILAVYKVGSVRLLDNIEVSLSS